jgi:FKBP-type peptidyl-prolyl cis-trans isomerase
MTTRKRDRFFAAFGALLFLVTASAFTIAIIWNGVSNHNNDKKTTDSSQNQTNNDTTKKASTKLEGTQLQNFTPTSSIPALKSEDTVVGTGDTVKAGDTVTVDYTGAVAATGKIFQSSLDSGQTATFGLAQVIKGWTDGIPGMKVGGTRRLLIPAAQAYGANPPSGSGIPANADLVFDVTLHKIGQ